MDKKTEAEGNGTPEQENAEEKSNFIVRCTNFVNTALETGFSRFGLLVGTHPGKTIAVTLIFALLCLSGLVRFEQESRGEKLWVEQSSQYVTDQNWVRDHFPTRIRYIQILLKGSDVLTPNGLKQMLNVDKMVQGMLANDSNSALHWKNRRFDTPTQSLIELWPGLDATTVDSMTKDDILRIVNEDPLISPTRNRNISIDSYLSGISKNSTQHIVQASVARMTYFQKFDVVLDKSTGMWKDEYGTQWEKEFAVVIRQTSFPGYEVFYSTLESFVKAGLDAIGNDYGLLFSGYALIITYVAFQLGKFSRLKHKVWLAAVGIIMVGLAFAVAMGLCAGAGVIYGPVHSILPFLMLGIGVDDLFVIIQTWDNVCMEQTKIQESVPEKISRTMKHAGVAITVTSFTDICAFLIGATTVLPALRSFCIYAGVGILMLYIYAATFFVAFLTIDAKRQEMNRDACCCFRLPDDWQPMACSNKRFLNDVLKRFGKIILTIPGKVIVVLLTGTLFGFGLYGILQLDQNFDPDWFLPRDSDEFLFRQNFRQFFPSHGAKTAVYVGKVDYFAEQKNLHALYDKMRWDSTIQESSVVSWYDHFITHLKNDPVKKTYLTNENIVSNETFFYDNLRQFLDGDGLAYKSSFDYNNNTMEIKGTRFLMSHKNIMETKKQIEAMDNIRQKATSVYFQSSKTTFSKTAFVFGDEYIRWQTNRIVGEELFRNLILAGVCVFLVTLFLIANLWTCLMVLMCVGFSLTNICGYMYYWDLSIDMIISTILVISLGFAVDYSGHIGHAFMAARKGTRNDRALTAISEIGPAVLNGGISTFLAFCLLAGSKSYAFQTFFKVFFLVVSIGLFHGLVFLPVLLSIIGPRAYLETESPTPEKANEEECSNSSASSTTEGDSTPKKNKVHVEYKSCSEGKEDGNISIENLNYVAS
ncbi:patched domain-containing protein 3-like [Clytia hemisphaerica]|uniref:SSD domain-containing protein n=1 Tax=Clytia hemisphaerica TaxID=252671 RepID=A0A7M5XMG2_9CNID